MPARMLACSPANSTLLALRREPAGHPTPEDVFLNLAAFARKTEPRIAQPPQLVHAQPVMGIAKPGAQQKPGQSEPGLFVLHRKLPAHRPFVQGRPKVAQERRVPLMPGQTDYAFQVFQDCIGGQPVGLRRRTGEYGRDMIPRGLLGLGRGVRLDGRRSRRTSVAALPCSCGRRLNSSGQDCGVRGSVLTQEICSSPSAFIFAARRTGTVRSARRRVHCAVRMIVCSGGSM